MMNEPKRSVTEVQREAYEIAAKVIDDLRRDPRIPEKELHDIANAEQVRVLDAWLRDHPAPDDEVSA